MVGVFGEEALHEFEAERYGGFDEVGVIVGGEGGAATGKGIADLIDGEAFEGAAGEQREEGQSEETGEQEVVAVGRPTLHKERELYAIGGGRCQPIKNRWTNRRSIRAT